MRTHPRRTEMRHPAQIAKLDSRHLKRTAALRVKGPARYAVDAVVDMCNAVRVRVAVRVWGCREAVGEISELGDGDALESRWCCIEIML